MRRTESPACSKGPRRVREGAGPEVTLRVLALFWSFAKVGIFGFGGGPSMIPLVQEEVVELQHWLTKSEFLDAFAFGNSLPGPIATKMAGYVGYQVAGWPGAVAALVGVSVPTVLAMILLATLYLRFKDNPAIEGFLKGVRPVVIALLALVVWDFAPKALGIGGHWERTLLVWGLAVCAFFLAVKFNVHPAALILIGGGLGALALR